MLSYFFNTLIPLNYASKTAKSFVHLLVCFGFGVFAVWQLKVSMKDHCEMDDGWIYR